MLEGTSQTLSLVEAKGYVRNKQKAEFSCAIAYFFLLAFKLFLVSFSFHFFNFISYSPKYFPSPS
jgi:predicted membrane channel-forming protein YqfA (hemolysin III family)